MKRYWIAMIVAGVAASLSAVDATAQVAQGAGAQEANEASSASHSYNPIKWIKKDTHTSPESLDARLTSKLRMDGLLAPNTNLDNTCSAIKALGECVAALHAGRNLGLDFDCLKSMMTGVQATADVASCPGGKVKKRMALDEAIRALKPGVNAKAEAKNAEKQSAADLREAGS